MSIQDIKEYLLPLPIPDIDKRYVLNFCKKNEYLEKLREVIAKDTGSDVAMGYGDLNSYIMFIFDNAERFNAIKPIIQEQMDKFQMNFWQAYLTFIDKTAADYPGKYMAIANEISAIKPKLLYVFGNNKQKYDDIINIISSYNIPLPERHFFINLEDMASEDDTVKKALWHQLRYLINYKTLDDKK